MSVLSCFVAGHYHVAFLLKEQARDRFLAKVPPSYDSLAPPHGFAFKMELLLSKSSTLLADTTTGWWVDAYTERVLRVIAAMIFDVYDTFRLWWLPPDVLRFARKLDDYMAP